MGPASDLGVGRGLVQRLQFALVVTLARHRPFVPRRWGLGERPGAAQGDTSVLTVGGGDEELRLLVERLGLAPEGGVRIAGLLALKGGIRHHCVLSTGGRGQAEEIGLPDVVEHLFGGHAPPSGRAVSVRRAPR